MKDLRSMLRHIESELPSTMYLPIPFDDILNFYWYLNTNVLKPEGQFMLIIDVPIQNTAQQLQIYEVFNLPVCHSNLSANTKVTTGTCNIVKNMKRLSYHFSFSFKIILSFN